VRRVVFRAALVDPTDRGRTHSTLSRSRYRLPSRSARRRSARSGSARGRSAPRQIRRSCRRRRALARVLGVKAAAAMAEALERPGTSDSAA
jgi:hypothetical protein